MKSSIEALQFAANRAVNYLETIKQRNVAPTPEALDKLSVLHESLPNEPSDPLETIKLLDDIGSPATVATAAGRFYGLVVGGSLPASLGARVLNSAWDQLVTTEFTSPIGVELEQVASKWILELFGLPQTHSVGFVTGTTMGNFVCLSAARHALLSKKGWDVGTKGLFDSPKLHIIASEETHFTVKKVLSMLGLGTDNVDYVPCDANGAMLLSELPPLTDMSLVLTQAGNVNSGACDPIGEIASLAQEVGAWVHVDGAFGLWAAASQSHKHSLSGFEKADSWVTDGHKWLNTPYDCGVAICKHPTEIHSAMATVAPYFVEGEKVAPKDMVPELSRTTRGIEMWAALRSLGRSGIEDLIDRCCRHARMMAKELDTLGFTILNDVVLNQVVATYDGKEHQMTKLTELVNESGEAWFGPTHWQGRDAFRISFSSWVTTDDDVIRAFVAIKSASGELGI